MLDSKKIITPLEYSDYIDVFSEASAIKLFKHTNINNHPIHLLNDKQPLYGLIYSLRPVELEILKIYVETNLANGIIQPSWLPTNTLILFIQKKDNSL